MSLSYEEVQAQRSVPNASANDQRIRQLRERQATGQKISELVADPRWEIFGREIESIRATYERRSEAAKVKLLNHLLLGDEYLQTKMEQAQADAAATALTLILGRAKVLIEQGEQAMNELKLTNGGQQA